jgi:hypothetical protein
MEKSLKDANRFSLYVVMVANLSLYYMVVQNNALIGGQWIDLIRNVSSALPAGLGIILTGILNAQLSAEAKCRVVFLRWRNPLPGCEAFSRYSKEDARIAPAGIARLCGPLPEDPREQNALWYMMYRSLNTEPSVVQAHRSFLFTRDYACIALALTVGLGVLGFVQIESKAVAAIYLVVLLIQFVVVSQASRNHGRRFVTTVLAIKAAGV